jgi:5-(carboxyamino)imidazole ribonucleotide mutase
MVGVIMGSASDWETMREAAAALKMLGVSYETRVVSAHRTPTAMYEYAQNARKRGLKVIVAGAGGAAHLPGMVASLTSLPVVGVPILSRNSLLGLDSLLSIVQMPQGIPVATVAVGGAFNAGILAARILGAHDPRIAQALENYQLELRKKVESMTLPDSDLSEI